MKKLFLLSCLTIQLFSCTKAEDNLNVKPSTSKTSSPVLPISTTKQSVIDYLNEYGYTVLDIKPKVNTIADWIGIVQMDGKTYEVTVLLKEVQPGNQFVIANYTTTFLY
jgi:hypothetical protein